MWLSETYPSWSLNLSFLLSPTLCIGQWGVVHRVVSVGGLWSSGCKFHLSCSVWQCQVWQLAAACHRSSGFLHHAEPLSHQFQVELIYCQGVYVSMTSGVICIFTSFLDETDSNQHASLQVVIFTWGLQDLLSFFSRNYFAILCQYVCI